MNAFKSSVIFMILSVLSFGCVTTREELNRQRESQTQKGPVVRSESLGPEAPQAPTGPAIPAASPTPPFMATQGTPGPAIPPASDATTLTEDELRAELARVSGRAEEIAHEKEENEKSQSEELKKAQERIAELESKLKEVTPEAPKVPEGKSPFEAGKDAFSRGQWDEAIAFLGEVILKDEAGKSLEEATYLRGEAFFKKLQYNKAILDYSKFPERFQKSSFHPKALLRIAESFEATDRKDDARIFYAELIEKFPKTAEGKLAKKRAKKP